jgi:hypothetical protein
VSQSFEAAHPDITRWVEPHGWIEIGADEYSTSLARILDEGGMTGKVKTMLAARMPL